MRSKSIYFANAGSEDNDLVVKGHIFKELMCSRSHFHEYRVVDIVHDKL
jgi:hypothetical protein